MNMPLLTFTTVMINWPALNQSQESTFPSLLRVITDRLVHMQC